MILYYKSDGSGGITKAGSSPVLMWSEGANRKGKRLFFLPSATDAGCSRPNYVHNSTGERRNFNFKKRKSPAYKVSQTEKYET